MVPYQDNLEVRPPASEDSGSDAVDARFLDRLIQALTDYSGPRDLADRVAEIVLDNTCADNASIMLFDGDSGNLVIAGVGSRLTRPGESGAPLTFSSGEGIAGWVAQHNIAVRLVDASKDRRFLHADTTQAQVRSLFVHPITAGNRMLGVMNLSSSLPGVLGTSDEHLVEMSCRYIGKAIERATEVDRFRTKLIQSETLSAAGSLLAGIVHELNNPLTTILGFSELMLRENSEHDVRLERIKAEAERCVRITQNVLKLGRRASGNLKTVDVHDAIRQTVELSGHPLRFHGIVLSLNLADGEAKTLAHEGELTQVFLNLITNAIQAISSAHRPGNISISSAIHEDRIRVSVKDDGPGVSAQEIERIFQPFYTTKQDGNGLGLSLSRKIVQDLGGEMWVSPNLRHGATFTVDLPLVDSEPEAATTKLPESPGLLKASPSVLIVDDEEHIVELVDTIVRGRGFKSTCCTEGQNALALLNQNDYDLLICDYHMPGKGGRELMEWIRESGRDTRVLVLSGDVVRTETRGLIEHLGAEYLSKPFGIDELVAAIDRALGV